MVEDSATTGTTVKDDLQVVNQGDRKDYGAVNGNKEWRRWKGFKNKVVYLALLSLNCW